MVQVLTITHDICKDSAVFPRDPLQLRLKDSTKRSVELEGRMRALDLADHAVVRLVGHSKI